MCYNKEQKACGKSALTERKWKGITKNLNIDYLCNESTNIIGISVVNNHMIRMQ